MKKIAIVVGTRPEVIKMSPVIKECESRGLNYILIHSNQHYSADMDEVFFKELKLKQPDYNLHIGSGKHGNQTGNILIKIEPILESEKPDVILVQGDTNTVMATALAASKLGIKIGHIEAGLRSYDKTMPEETNRVVTDHMSDYLFAVTDKQQETLKKEGIDSDKIKVVGNTIVDALLSNIDLAEKESKILSDLNLEGESYILFTAHRAGNVDIPENLQKVLEIVNYISDHTPYKIVWPIHPRTRKNIEAYHYKLNDKIICIGPTGYLDFLMLERSSSLIVTDSGGLQEEACILNTPCITIRENTERPETVDVGANKLVGLNIKLFKEAFTHFTQQSHTWDSPFGDGKTSQKIIDEITSKREVKSPELKKTQPTVSVIGLGYMGFPMACLLANSGYRVTGVDLNQEKVDAVNTGKSPIQEDGIDDLFSKAYETGNISAVSSVEKSDVYIVAVPTPSKDKKCDLKYVLAAMEDISSVAKDGDLVILESTVKPGTCKAEVSKIFEKKDIDIRIVHCPERAIPGNTLHELVHNDRIVGGEDKDAIKRTVSIYKSFVKGKIFETDLTTAETVKLVENTSRDVNIALANELDLICTELDINVWEVISLANRHPRVNILRPGPGVGGHCIAVDPWFLTENTKSAQLISTARSINDNRPSVIVKRALEKLNSIKGSKVGLLGLAYKKNVDDCRETPAIKILDLLHKNNVEARSFDPLVKEWPYPTCNSFKEIDDWADLLILVTDHDVFKKEVITKPVIDTQNLFQNLD